jgi:HlyD family secretion protein
MIMTRRKIFWGLPILIVGGILLYVLQKAIRGPEVPAVKAQRGAVVQKVVASGQIIPRTRINVTSQVMGTVAEVMVQEGDVVQAGQALVQIASQEASAQVEQAQAAYELAQAKADQFQGVSTRLTRETLRQAEVKLRQARLDVKREEELSRANASTQEALDQARSALQLAESTYQSAMAQVKATAPQGSDSRMALAAVEQSHGALAAAEARLAQFRITAPLAARVIQRRIEPGDGVQPGTPMLVLGSVDAPRALVQVDEKYLSLLRDGLAARVTADAYPGRSFEAKVERIAPSVNQERGSIEVQLIIAEAPPFLRFDMSASVEIITNSAEGALMLPIEAVQAAATEEPFIYVAEKGKAEKRPIALGLRGDTVVEIASGVKPDDLVLLPTEALKPGARVRPDLKGGQGAL